MLGAAILWVGLATVGAGDYTRPFGEKVFDQATLDAEGFGDKKALAREADGLRVTLKPGEAEAGWKTPQGLRIGGDCTIVATLVLKTLPKPGGEDGAAVGLAVATQNIDQPEATLLREVEPDGREVYRPIDKGAQNPQAQMVGMNPGMVMFDPFGNQIQAKPAKPTRLTVPAKGRAIRLEFRRQGPTLRYQVFDEMAALPREIGQFNIGPGDIAGVKLFASNRNGAEAVDVLFREVAIHADRIGGLGTAVRTIRGSVVYGDPTAIDAGTLVVGGPPPTPAPGASPSGPAGPKPAAPAAPAGPPVAAVPPPAAPVAVQGMVVVQAGGGPAGVVFQGVPGPGRTVVETTPGAPPSSPGAPGTATPPPAAKPKVRLPLDEVETIAIERSSTPAARFLGQPNVDTTGPVGTPAAGAEAKDAKKPASGDDLAAPPPGTVAPVKVPKVDPKPNGIRDLHLALSGLREAAIKQVTVQCPTDKGQASWRLDTSGSTDWPLVLRRAGVESWADLFLEPPAGDVKDKQLTIMLTYADGQNANIQAKATGPSDPKLAFDPAATTAALDARVYLSGDEQLFGKLDGIVEDALRLTTPWGDKLDVPLTRVVGVYMGMPDHKESPESFAKRLKARGTEDVLLARAKDGEVVAIGGVVEGVKDNTLAFLYGGKGRTLPLKGVEGFLLAARPGPKPPEEVRPTFSLAGGLVVSGRWTSIGAESWGVETTWGQAMKLPAAEVRGVRVRGGQLTYLSDLDPSRVDEVPYFGRRSPYRRDVDLSGGPLKRDGQVIEKGLAVHSRSELTYDLDRRYATFEATVGFDDAGKKKGRVDCRVFADGKEVYANPDLRADAPPVPLSLSVAGAEQLRLVVDFGPDEDTGDRLIWGNARLYRRPREAAPTTTPAASKP